MIRFALGVVGLAIALAGAALLIGGGAVFVADATLTDADGFYAVPPAYIGFDSYAVISEAAAVSEELPWFLEQGRLASLRISADPHGQQMETFIGIASAEAANAYLVDVPRHEIASLAGDSDQFNVVVHEGQARPAPPMEQGFWLASTVEQGEPLIWPVGEGEVVFVIMNLDATPGIDAVVSVGVKIPLLETTAVTLLVGGGVTAVIGTLLFAAAF